jgi:hypothetical protein
VKFLDVQLERFVAVAASSQNDFEAVQYVEAYLRVTPLFCMVTGKLTGGSQLFLVHSPFPI